MEVTTRTPFGSYITFEVTIVDAMDLIDTFLHATEEKTYRSVPLGISRGRSGETGWMQIRILAVRLRVVGNHHREPEPNESAENGTPVFEAQRLQVVSVISQTN